MRAGVPGRVASASVLVDKAAMPASHVLFALVGSSGFSPGSSSGCSVSIGSVLGIGPGIGLELSLMKRVRELAIGVPALALWPVRGGGFRRAQLAGTDAR